MRGPSELSVRPAQAGDYDAWVHLRTLLWPDSPDDHSRELAAYFEAPPERERTFVAILEGAVVGFVETRLRDHAEECYTSPVGYIEGIYVVEGCRAQGVGRALVIAAEGWAKQLGCKEMASDRDLMNEASGDFHLAIGFEEVSRLVAYRKELR